MFPKLSKKTRSCGGALQKFHKRVIKTDGCCANPDCPMKGKKPHLEAHHLIPRSQGGSNDLDNGITLCMVCHAMAHGVIIARDKDGRAISPYRFVLNILDYWIAKSMFRWAKRSYNWIKDKAEKHEEYKRKETEILSAYCGGDHTKGI